MYYTCIFTNAFTRELSTCQHICMVFFVLIAEVWLWILLGRVRVLAMDSALSHESVAMNLVWTREGLRAWLWIMIERARN